MIARDKRERILGLARKELLEVFRDPNLLRIVVIAPVIQLVVFGYAVSTDVHRVSTFVVDQDHSADSRNLTQTFFASGYFRFVGASERPRDLVEAMNRGRALVGLQIPRGFEKEGARDEAAVQVVLDAVSKLYRPCDVAANSVLPSCTRRKIRAPLSSGPPTWCQLAPPSVEASTPTPA